MSLISTWSTVANANGTLGGTPQYWPEGQAPSTVNDCARLMMATLRSQWNDAEWFNWGYTVTKVSGTSFSVITASANTVTLPAAFEVAARIKLYGTSTIYGTITTVSVSALSTLVTFTPDAGSLTNSFSSVFNSIISPTNTAIPGLNIPTDVITQKCPQIYAVDTGATNSAQITLTPVLSAYAAGQMINFKAAAPNTGAITLQVDVLGVQSIKNSAGSNLSSGDIVAGQIVTVVYNGTYFQLVSGAGGGGGGSSDAVISSITQAAHGFSVGQVLYINSSTYTLANASAASTAEVVGIIETVPTVNTFTLVTGGHITGLSGLTPGAVYFLSGLMAGALTATPPTTANYVNKPLLVADSSTSGYFINYRGEIISTVPTSSLVVQRVSTQTGAVATGTTALPIDDTIPQKTEGDQFMSLSITPLDAAHILEIRVQIYGSESGAASYESVIGALFQDTTTNAIATMVGATSPYTTSTTTLNFTYIMTAGTTSSTTFKVRSGNPTGTFTFNGSGAARQFGGVLCSSIEITEYTT